MKTGYKIINPEIHEEYLIIDTTIPCHMCRLYSYKHN